MATAFYMDVHVPWAIVDQLRRRGIDVVTAVEDGRGIALDGDILARAHQLQRLVFTQDIRFRVLAERWQQEGRAFHGLLFGHQLAATIGQYVLNLELIAQASNQEEWVGIVERLPY